MNEKQILYSALITITKMTTDNRKTNYITGQNRENEIYSLLRGLYESGIISEEVNKLGGRNNNYDLTINNHKIEVKNNASNINELPEILQIACSSFDLNYITVHFDEVIGQVFQDIDFDEYVKNINSITHEGVFSQIYEQRQTIETPTKQLISSYIANLNNDELSSFVEKVILKLQEQTEKTFVLYKDGQYYVDRIEDDFSNVSIKKGSKSIIIETDNYEYKCLLRWKNGIGVNYPAWQISAHKKYKTLMLNEIGITKEEMKEFGIFFTPEPIVKQCFKSLNELGLTSFNTICEPSAGFGVFIDHVLKSCNNVTAYELNTNIFSQLEDKYKHISHVRLINDDYLNSSTDEKFDLIIGNPPYFITSDKRYKEYFTGRTNIFVQFIVHSLLKLSTDGVLCFVIPQTFLNCQYYTETRLFIKSSFEIMALYQNPDLFTDTKYKTITMILRKHDNANEINEHWFYNSVMIMNDDLNEMMLKPHTTINEMMTTNDLNVSVGNFVWNQHKELLKDINDEKYSSNPVLLYGPNNDKRRSYVIDVDKSFVHHSSIIIINRGYGQSKYKFNFEFIDNKDYPNGFIVENHNLIISSNDETLLNHIYTMLSNNETKQFVESYITNGAMSVNDLKFNILLFE